MSSDTFITSTGLSDTEKSELELIVRERYANTTYSPDLTTDVKVLVINKRGSHNIWLKSRKFMFVASFRPDIKVIDLREICDSDNFGKDISELASIKPFENLKVSLSRLEDGMLDKIRLIINNNGGKAVSHLTNDTDVLISMVAEGQRYVAAVKWGIPVVSPDWCFDTLERGLPLNTVFYKLSTNVTNIVRRLNFENDEDKVGSEFYVKTYQLGRRDQACDWEKLKEWRDKESDRQLESYIKSRVQSDPQCSIEGAVLPTNVSLSANNDLKRKFGKGDTDEDDIVKIRKSTKTDALWDSVIKKKKPKSVESALSSPDLLKRMMMKKKEVIVKDTKQEKKPIIAPKGSILGAYTFKLEHYTDDERHKLQKVISKFGGKITEDESPCDFKVINYKFNDVITDTCSRYVVTEFAIERFIYNERVDFDQCLWCKPLIIPAFTTKEFRIRILQESVDTVKSEKKVKTCISGFQGTDLSQIERIVKEKLENWVEFSPIFDKSCELLVVERLSSHHVSSPITNSVRKQNLASKWGVRVLCFNDFLKNLLE